MRIAIIGSGISGLVTAHLLHPEHEITVFEANDYIGGHTNTIDVELEDGRWAVDTGFIVFNDRTYPNFVKLIDRLGVRWKNTSMSFSVRCEASGLEYSGKSLGALFAQRKNVLRWSFLRMLAQILRFNRQATRLLQSGDDSLTLGEYLRAERYSREFIDHYIVPMGAAIWSTDPVQMQGFPARYFVRFFHNHGMLTVKDQPTWRVIEGGSRTYVDALTAPFRERIRLSSPVSWVRRREDYVQVLRNGAPAERFDHVVFATHSDQALRLLADPTPREREILGAIPYQPNEAVLHTDDSLLPRARRAWSSWNYHVRESAPDQVALTYNMNMLQGLDAPHTFCVTLNHGAAIDPARVIKRITYHHPLYTPAAVAAQQRHGEISGVGRTHYCGAYWRHGFHEDGVVSALAVARHFGRTS